MSQQTEEEIAPELDWVALHDELSGGRDDESQKTRLWKKIEENPFVPIGALATTMALTFGLYSFYKGERKMSQYMMRTRIAAQGFTVAALVAGLALSTSKTLKNKSAQ